MPPASITEAIDTIQGVYHYLNNKLNTDTSDAGSEERAAAARLLDLARHVLLVGLNYFPGRSYSDCDVCMVLRARYEVLARVADRPRDVLQQMLQEHEAHIEETEHMGLLNSHDD